METIATVAGRLAEEAQKQLYRQNRQQQQDFLRTHTPTEVAEAQGKRCRHCGMLLVPEIRTARGVHGETLYAAYPDCICDGARQARREHDAQQEQREKRAREQAFNTALANAGLRGWLSTATLDTFKARQDWPGAVECAQRVRAFVDSTLQGTLQDRCWLILYGRYGTGKSHLAAAAIREAISYGWRDCYFRPWTAYLKRLQDSWDKTEGGERTGDIVAEAQRGRLVAIDDLDKKRPGSGWAIEELYSILNHRYNGQLPTILTFNYAPDTPDPDEPGKLILERYMGRAILDRVIGARYACVSFDGPSYRSGVKWEV